MIELEMVTGAKQKEEEGGKRLVLRVKRKRDAPAVENLLVKKKKKKTLNEEFAQLLAADDENKLVFRRIETLEAACCGGGGGSDRMTKKLRKSLRSHSWTTKSSNNSQFQQKTKSMRQAQIQTQRDKLICVLVDLPDTQTHAQAKPDPEVPIAVNGEQLIAKQHRILNPFERQLDEAIWTAFHNNDFSHFFLLLKNDNAKKMLKGDDEKTMLNFQRQSDGTTILMAAAYHGRVDVLDYLMHYNDLLDVLLTDNSGKTASELAHIVGHVAAGKALEKCEAFQRDKDYVYDVYCFDDMANTSRLNQLQNHQQDDTGNDNDNEIVDFPVVSVDENIEHWLTNDKNLPDNVFEFEANLDEFSDVDEIENDYDSNAEDNSANDYPDEEDSSDFYSSDEEENKRMKMWSSNNSGFGEEECDY